MAKSPYVEVPTNVDFSDFREVNETFDEFDIIICGHVVRTMKVNCSSIKGSSSEEFVYAQAHRDAITWLKECSFISA
jgi:hypothetical protein